MRSWEITTQRDTVDTTILGEEYKEYYDQGLVSGQGQSPQSGTTDTTPAKTTSQRRGASELLF